MLRRILNTQSTTDKIDERGDAEAVLQQEPQPRSDTMSAWKPPVFLFLALFGLWLLWSGSYSLPFGHGHGEGDHEGSWKLTLGLGFLSTLAVTVLSWRMRILDENLVPFHLTWPTLRYVPWLAVEVVKSNLDVIQRILKGPIHPTVIKVKALARSDLARMTFANSITLTPGTLTLDAEDEVITVHSLSKRGAKVLEGGEMNRRIAHLEEGAE